MWFDEAGEVVEMFRSSFPLSLLFFLPICILISPISPASAAHEFAVYRMQQYDLGGTAYGCRNALVNVEARPIDTSSVTRRCVVARLADVTAHRFKELAAQNAAGLLVLLPDNLHELSKPEQEHLLELERDLVEEQTPLPVFFVNENEQVRDIYDDISVAGSADAESAAAELMKAAYANGFQLVVNGAQSKALNDFQVVNLQGKLSGSGIEDQLPTVAIVAHYDAHGVAPALSYGADSNGSGVAALLELARLFSKLYANSRTHAKYNLMFLLSGAGKYNYQGTKRWIEDQLDNAENSLLSEVSYVLCLDSLAQSDELHLHVSKPPKEGSAGDFLVKSLTDIVTHIYPSVNFSVQHKRINLAQDFLAWEHERFSIRRLPAFTLSHFQHHHDPARKSILDTQASVDKAAFSRNVHILAEALARHVFGLDGEGMAQIFHDGLQVEDSLLLSWLDYLSSVPRSAQMLNTDSAVVNTLHQALQRCLKDVKRITFKADKRDPDFLFYDGAEYTMNAYNVKPAVFDLFLALAIASYLAAIWFVVQNFGGVFASFRKPVSHANGKTNGYMKTKAS